MQINKEITDILYHISWFENCGKQGPSQLGIKAESVDEVKKHITSLRWENIELEYQGAMTGKLCNRSCQGIGKEYHEWNNLVNEFKSVYLPKMKRQWINQLSLLNLNDKDVLNSITFNILGIVMADAFKEILPMSSFYVQLMEIYKSGYLPCGWLGKKDKGCFVIY